MRLRPAVLGRSKRRDPLADVNLLELAPLRLGEWEEKDGRILVTRPRPRGRGLAFVNAWLAYQTSPRKIRLDPVGSFAWQRLDGRKTVAEIAAALRREFGAEVEPAEERLGRMVQVMHREGLVVYPGFEEVPVSYPG